MTESNPVLYILMRNDLPSMNAGKAMAQASHASNAFTNDMLVGKASTSVAIDRNVELYKTWKSETKQGFGTVLVLAVDENQMRSAIDVAQSLDFVSGVVHDPTYPIQIAPELGKALTLVPGLGVSLTAHDVRVGENHNYMTISLDTCAYVFGDKNDLVLGVVVGRFPLHP